MNEILGNNILRLRKENDLTQEELAHVLGITYQAVSKWETGVSCPDVSTLPLLADLFGVSIDELFGRAAPAEKAEEKSGEGEAAPAQGVTLPWPDDEDMLHVVLFAGHKLLGGDEKGEGIFSRKQVTFQYEGPAMNIWSDFNVSCDQVQGSVNAGGDVDCDAVGGDVEGNLSAGGNVVCRDVEGSVSAGGSVVCKNAAGEVQSDGDFRSNLKDKKRGFSFELKL